MGESALQAIRTNTTPPVSIADGLAAVDLAEKIVTSVQEHDWNR